MSSTSISQGSKGQPGILTLNMASSSVIFNTTQVIYKQNMLLQNVRIEMDSAANALIEKVIYLDFPFWNNAVMVDNNVGHFYLPIFLDNAIVTLQNTLQMPIHMKQDIPERFEGRVLNGSFTPLSGLVYLSVQFSFAGDLQP